LKESRLIVLEILPGNFGSLRGMGDVAESKEKRQLNGIGKEISGY
jgi:hypothetical protein